MAIKKDGRSTKSVEHRKAISEGLKRYWAKQKKGNPNAGKLTAHGKKVAAEKRAAKARDGVKEIRDARKIAQKNVAAKRAARAEGKGHWNAKVDNKAIKLFKTLPTSQLRKRQNLAEKQMATAYKTNNGKALEDLQKMHNALTREMLRRTK